MAYRNDAPLLGDFSFKPVGLGDCRGERFVTVANHRRAHGQRTLSWIANDGKDSRMFNSLWDGK